MPATWRMPLRRDVITAYVEKLLGAQTGSDRVVADGDGDYPVRFGSARYYVRLLGEPDPDVQVFAVALNEVPATPELLAELNDINGRIRFARIFHVHEEVLVETNIVGESVDPLGLRTACEAVGEVADKVGAILAKKYGGRRAFTTDDDADAPPTGMYLLPIPNGTGPTTSYRFAVSACAGAPMGAAGLGMGERADSARRIISITVSRGITVESRTMW